MLAQYLDGELNREAAIERVGRASFVTAVPSEMLCFGTRNTGRETMAENSYARPYECVTVVAVSDTGPLIHLAEIDSLELFSTFDMLLVPETIYEEIETGGVPDELAGLYGFPPPNIPELPSREAKQPSPGRTTLLEEVCSDLTAVGA